MYCQKCKTPLRLDNSLENLSTSALQHLTGAPLALQQPSSPEVPQTPQQAARRERYAQASHNASSSPIHKRSTPREPSDPAAMSFVLLSESQITPPPTPTDRRKSSGSRQGTPSKKGKGRSSAGGRQGAPVTGGEDNLFSHKALTSDRIFEILSSRSDIDHPICGECSDTILQRMEARLASAAKERDAFAEFLRNLQADQPTDEEAEQTRKELEAVRKQEAKALKELQGLEKEKSELEAEFRNLEAESQLLEKEESAFWHEHNTHQAEMQGYAAQKESAELRLQNDQRLLERLQRTNVYNDTFNISHDGSFGTINGLRLGRLSYPTVEWAEVNAAWGQALLLLSVMAEKLDYKFQGYRLLALGSFSKIEKLETLRSSTTSSSSQTSSSKPARASKSAAETTKTELPLYHIPDMNPLSGTFFHRPFDAGMIAFLECLRQLGQHLEQLTSSARSKDAEREQPRLRLPYEIKKDRIHDCSIKLGSFGGDEGWTKACKYALTCLKFLLAGASNVGAVGGGGGKRGEEEVRK
ncbi:MAG: autophagy protein 6 [Chrysothrix sp. TS-e1954]|nr:MAG: autophagy protein 6 [Chrysothrix sp. TS-e1954]